jgi:hypothetical protein
MGTDSPDGFYCYWPMPFRDGVRVELVNVSGASIEVDSVVLEHESQPIASDFGYLHVGVQKTIVQPGQTRNVMASVTGAGHYVGNLLYVEDDHDTHFFLEGDDIAVVDGTRRLNGTGIEDAYNGGFYYNWVNNPMEEPEGPSPPFAIRPLHGILRVERSASPPFGRADQYRWQIADRVPFAESLEVSVETQYCWAGCQWISVVFWYGLHPVASGARPWHDDDAQELGFELWQNFPNPASDVTTIRFSLPVDVLTQLEIVDVRGRRVDTLIDGRRLAGRHEVLWRTRELPNGLYFLKLRAGAFTETRKLVVLR